LTKGDTSMQLGTSQNTPDILALYADITPFYENLKAGTSTIINAENVESLQQPEYQDAISSILSNEGPFLKLMNDIVFEYDAEAAGKVASLSTREYVLFAIVLTLLFLLGLFVFRPAIKKVNESNAKILAYEKEQKEAALSDKQYLTNQAEIIFSNVKQGIFLLDQELIIDSFYSKETESIFDEETIAQTNFLKLMKHRLMPRDLEALELFVENLFNADIRENVVNRLNPVTQVEIFNDINNSSIENRYIGFTFSRIIRDDKIYRILVTVLDETDNVLMRRKIEEAEERNKKESEQLLAVLKVKPQVLKDYLNTTIASLSTVSARYENSKDQDFQSLISYTFNTVHSAKGNASLINLTLIETKLHKIEESLTVLRSQDNIEGKNFLRILYEVTEVSSILNNMNDMLVSIAEAYEQFSQESNNANSNKILVETLEKGISRLSKEQGKEIEFSFEDNDLNVPEEHRLGVKDLLIQLVRNSIVHGIESADDRQFSGKSPTGNISISITKSDDDALQYNFQDDGQGLDLDKICETAIANNLITEAEAESMTAEQKTELIFKDSFSTADQVDNNAGRGQGMSIVQSIVNKY
ncbi:MAG: ATP-binding protein, partial [Bacteroidota bacterium]